MSSLALTDLLGALIYDSNGARAGRVREVALRPQEDPVKLAGLLVKTEDGERMLPLNDVASINGGIRASKPISKWSPNPGMEGLLLLQRDLLDQQIIDVHGRKVVRVNDVELYQDRSGPHPVLKVASVDVGTRGAVRRLLKGLVPGPLLRAVLRRIP